MAQYPKIESTGSIGSIILAILEVQVGGRWTINAFKGYFVLKASLVPRRPSEVAAKLRPREKAARLVEPIRILLGGLLNYCLMFLK